MKKVSLVGILVLFVTTAWSQIKFEKGYFIDNDNNRVEVLIKDVDWGYNPTAFEYKTSENSESASKSVADVKEFGVGVSLKYISRKVKIDRSSEVLSQLTANSEPEFKEERLFLKSIVEGTANLYYYEDRLVKRFFYTVNDSQLEQLVFKSYLGASQVGASNKIGVNTRFRQQLYNSLQCASVDKRRFQTLRYDKKPIMNVFTDYNALCGSSNVTFENKVKRQFFVLSVRPRFTYSSMTAKNDLSTTDYEWSGKGGFGLGVEGEFILPFNKNKWSLIVEPTFRSYTASTTTRQSSDPTIVQIADLDYKSIEIPMGVRYRFFLNDDNQIFLNAVAIFDMSTTFSSSIKIRRLSGSSVNDLETFNDFNGAFGAGFKHKAFSIEGRVQSTRNILLKYISWVGDYQSYSVIVGYSMFGKKK